MNVAIQPIGTALGGSTAALQWIVNAYTLGLASLILSAGAWGDRIGARRLYVGGFAVFTLASAACGLAPSLGVLIAARAGQRIGAAMLIPCSLTLLTHSHPGPERARAVGVALFGPLADGRLVPGLRFSLLLSIALALVVAALTGLDPSARSGRRGRRPGCGRGNPSWR